MSLRRQAVRDARSFLQNQNEFGWGLVITSPAGQRIQYSGFWNHHHTSIDPETGQAVSGQNASVALSIIDLRDQGMELPVNIHDASKKPWTVCVTDPEGREFHYKVQETMPDHMFEVVVLLLEAYQP